MKFLELKIPPVVLLIIFIGLMRGASSVCPDMGLSHSIRLCLFSVMAIAAGLIVTAGLLRFRAAGTTVEPTKPESSSSLVQSGIYQYTRNPMYLGFAVFLFGLGLYLDNALSIFLVLAFMGYMTIFQIKPEERALKKIFGNEFQQYMRNTRRWL